MGNTERDISVSQSPSLTYSLRKASVCCLPGTLPSPARTINTARSYSTAPAIERALLVAVDARDLPQPWPVELSLDELDALARSTGAIIAGRVIQKLPRPMATTYLGAGKLDSVKQLCDSLDSNLVIFNDELSPKQQRYLEDYPAIKVLDRTALILDVFARRARTREGKVQVELAQHKYLMPRLAGQWSHLERLGGGIGTRGPGESQLETDRRLIRQRITRLEKQLNEIRQHRNLYQQRRLDSGLPQVCLVGYTNAGKSTLLNALTNADAEVRHTLFSTLDPTTRQLSLGNGRSCLLSDTVGFIHKLPPSIVAAFRATLEELNDATLLLLVIDITHPLAKQRLEVVQSILKELGLGMKRQVLVCNKIDRVTSSETDFNKLNNSDFLSGNPENAIIVSASRGWGLTNLRLLIASILYPSVKA
jgi:GTP-binding protein HflX